MTIALPRKLLKTSTYKTQVLLISLLLVTACSQAIPTATDLSKRQQELKHLLKHDCGSCHGMSLKGGLGPALLPEALAGKPDELLFVTIQHGRPGTPMPPWKSQLSEQDIHWLIQQLRKGVD